MKTNEILTHLKQELKKFGFVEHKAKHYGKGFFLKNGEYPFQIAVLRIIALDNEKFYVVLSFDLRVENGLANYIEPWRRDGKERYIYYTETSCHHDYTIAHDKIYDGGDIPIGNEFHSIEDFIKLFENLGMEIVEKYLDPKNNLQYLLDGYQTEKSISKAREIAIIYEQLGDKIKSASFLKECISKYNDEYENNRYLAYIGFLEKGASLPHIPSPLDKVTTIQTTGNDIYFLINKKTIKDGDLLEYFGSIDKFNKPQKISYEEMNNEEGITILKAGKWSILRIGIDIFLTLDQEKIESMLVELSAKYSRTILFINQDTSNTFGFEVYKKGEFLRRWMTGDGEVLENIGKPITGEKKRFTDTLKEKQDSDSVVEFLDTVLKITYADLEKSKTLLYEMK